MKYSRIIATAVCLLFSSSPAWAINCAKAESAVEKSICSDVGLQQLDDVLGRDYQNAVKESGRDPARKAQQSWLQQRDLCTTDQCLREAYMARIKELSGAGSLTVLRQASPDWDFVLGVAGCDNDPSYPRCEGPGRLDIFHKNTGQVFQRISLPNIFAETNTKGEAGANLAELYGDNNSALMVGDFNFDGSADIALRDGNTGAYGGPSYTVFLFDPAAKRFAENAALTELAGSNLGFFDVDDKEKTLTTFTKSGCCWHQTSVYSVVRNKPVLIQETTEDARGDDNMVIITERKLVDGRWRETKTKEKMEE